MFNLTCEVGERGLHTIVGDTVVANSGQDQDASHDIRAGINMPAKEISPGLYQHQFEHFADDGGASPTRTLNSEPSNPQP